MVYVVAGEARYQLSFACFVDGVFVLFSLRLKTEKKCFRSRCDVLMAQLMAQRHNFQSQLKALGSLHGTRAGCWSFTLSVESELQICRALSGAVAG